MEENFGKVYREIRLDKRIKQKEVCSKNMAISTISKLENGKEIPNFLYMCKLLEKIDMTLHEFEYHCNKDFPSVRTKLILDFQSITSSAQIDDVQNLLTRCTHYLIYENDILIKELSDVLTIFLLIHNRKNSSEIKLEEIANNLWNKIKKRNEWYHHELDILNHVLFIFSKEIIFDIIDKLLEHIDDFSDFKPIEPLRISILLNLSLILIKNDELTLCEKFSKLAIFYATKSKRYDFIAVAYVRYGISTSDTTLIDKGLKILEFIGDETMRVELKKEVDLYIRK
ncbi:MAG: helix-turn-helix domain-containing protein [Streptococcaceae bacterium]|nr:helix-turn-helix domain-containing protein [Streptococcaceae bacterium]